MKLLLKLKSLFYRDYSGYPGIEPKEIRSTCLDGVEKILTRNFIGKGY